MTIQQLKAISLKRIVGAYKVPAKGDTNWLVVIAGVVTDAATKTKDTGVHRVYSGDFLARSLVETPAKDDKPAEFIAGRAGELIVPGVAEDMLDEAGVGTPGTFTNFVMRIGVRGDAKGRPEHVAEFLHAPESTSPAEALAKEHAPDILGKAEAEQTKPAAAPTKTPAKK
jgi:hypothetical protein